MTVHPREGVVQPHREEERDRAVRARVARDDLPRSCGRPRSRCPGRRRRPGRRPAPARPARAPRCSRTVAVRMTVRFGVRTAVKSRLPSFMRPLLEERGDGDLEHRLVEPGVDQAQVAGRLVGGVGPRDVGQREHVGRPWPGRALGDLEHGVAGDRLLVPRVGLDVVGEVVAPVLGLLDPGDDPLARGVLAQRPVLDRSRRAVLAGRSLTRAPAHDVVVERRGDPEGDGVVGLARAVGHVDHLDLGPSTISTTLTSPRAT